MPNQSTVGYVMAEASIEMVQLVVLLATAIGLMFVLRY